MNEKSFIILAKKNDTHPQKMLCIVIKLCEQNTFALKAFFDIPPANNSAIKTNWPEKWIFISTFD